MGLFQDLFGTPKPYVPIDDDTTDATAKQKKIDLKDGLFEDESMFSPNFKFQVEEDLKGTLKDYSTRAAVGELFYQSRGGRGITRQEIKDGLYRLVREGRINEDQMWAVRRHFKIY